jgi:hypothetical protein
MTMRSAEPNPKEEHNVGTTTQACGPSNGEEMSENLGPATAPSMEQEAHVQQLDMTVPATPGKELE